MEHKLDYTVILRWHVLDVQAIKPQWDITKCKRWLDENFRTAQGRIAELGNEILADLLEAE